MLTKRKRHEIYYAVAMPNDSMEPAIKKGEYILIIAGDLKFDPYSLENKIVVITDENKFYIRRIKNKTFTADNIKYKPIKDFKNYRIIGSAVIVVSTERLI